MPAESSFTWRNGITPQIVLENWTRPALEAAAEEFATHLYDGAWYAIVREDTGFSGDVWAAAISDSEVSIIGADYVPYVNAHYDGALERIWEEFDVNEAIRRRGVEP